VDPTGLQTNPYWQAVFERAACMVDCALPWGGVTGVAGWITNILCGACISAPNPPSCIGCIAGLVASGFSAFQFGRCIGDCIRDNPLPDPCDLEWL